VKQRMNSADMAAEVACLRRRVIGLRVTNIYDISPKVYVFKLSRSGEEGEKVFLLLESGSRFHITEAPQKRPDVPSNFCLKLRKHLVSKRLEEISQLGVDRRVDFSFGSGPLRFHLIFEGYSQGNIILTDSSFEILTLLRSHRDDAGGGAATVMARHPYPMHGVRLRGQLTDESGILKGTSDSSVLTKDDHLPSGERNTNVNGDDGIIKTLVPVHVDEKTSQQRQRAIKAVLLAFEKRNIDDERTSKNLPSSAMWYTAAPIPSMDVVMETSGRIWDAIQSSLLAVEERRVAAAAAVAAAEVSEERIATSNNTPVLIANNVSGKKGKKKGGSAITTTLKAALLESPQLLMPYGPSLAEHVLRDAGIYPDDKSGIYSDPESLLLVRTPSPNDSKPLSASSTFDPDVDPVAVEALLNITLAMARLEIWLAALERIDGKSPGIQETDPSTSNSAIGLITNTDNNNNGSINNGANVIADATANNNSNSISDPILPGLTSGWIVASISKIRHKVPKTSDDSNSPLAENKKEEAEVKEEEEILTYQEFAPLPLRQFTDYPDRFRLLRFVSFDAAVDEFFARSGIQRAEAARKEAEAVALARLDKIRSDQSARVAALETEADLCETRAEVLIANAEASDAVLAAVNQALAAGMTWPDLAEWIRAEKRIGNPLAMMVVGLKFERNAIVLEFHVEEEIEDLVEEDASIDAEREVEKPPNMERQLEHKKKKKQNDVVQVTVDLALSAFSNARQLFEARRKHLIKAEKTRQANAAALIAAEQRAEQQIRQVRSVAAAAAATSLLPTRKPLWFERFHWFISSEGYLVLSGRDAHQNETLVKRYFQKGDVYVHAELHGASSTIVKNHLAYQGGSRHDSYSNQFSAVPSSTSVSIIPPIPPLTLQQAGQVCCCRSRAWDQKTVASAWWVDHAQVSKTAPTGEYLTVGSFMIRGKKNYLPPQPLVMGFGILFRLEEGCVAAHRKREQKELEEEGPLKDDMIEGRRRGNRREEGEKLRNGGAKMLKEEETLEARMNNGKGETFEDRNEQAKENISKDGISENEDDEEAEALRKFMDQGVSGLTLSGKTTKENPVNSNARNLKNPIAGKKEPKNALSYAATFDRYGLADSLQAAASVGVAQGRGVVQDKRESGGKGNQKQTLTWEKEAGANDDQGSCKLLEKGKKRMSAKERELLRREQVAAKAGVLEQGTITTHKENDLKETAGVAPAKKEKQVREEDNGKVDDSSSSSSSDDNSDEEEDNNGDSQKCEAGITDIAHQKPLGQVKESVLQKICAKKSTDHQTTGDNEKLLKPSNLLSKNDDKIKNGKGKQKDKGKQVDLADDDDDWGKKGQKKLAVPVSSAPPLRGKKGKAKKMKEKYFDQDESDREVAMYLLASKGEKKTAEMRRKERKERREAQKAAARWESGAASGLLIGTDAQQQAIERARGLQFSDLKDNEKNVEGSKTTNTSKNGGGTSGGCISKAANAKSSNNKGATKNGATVRKNINSKANEGTSDDFNVQPEPEIKRPQEDDSTVTIVGPDGSEAKSLSAVSLDQFETGEGNKGKERRGVTDASPSFRWKEGEEGEREEEEGEDEEGQEQAQDGGEEEKEWKRLSILDSLVGQPFPGDILLSAVPVCAPYNALTHCKYKVKIVPGQTKKGRAARLALEVFSRNIDASLAAASRNASKGSDKSRDEAKKARMLSDSALKPESDGLEKKLANEDPKPEIVAEETEASATAARLGREKALMKAIPENDVIAVFVGQGVKLAVAGLQKIQTEDKKAKKAKAKAKAAAAAAAAAGGNIDE